MADVDICLTLRYRIAPLGYYHETYFDKTRRASHPVTSSYL